MVNRNQLNTPEGMKSYLPETCCQFKEIKKDIESVFEVWGYRPIITPTLEYYQSLALGMGQQQQRDFYKLIDYEGNILALKPEMTAPIARTVVNRMEEFSLPLRLSYDAPVFRYDAPQMGKNREIYQMGMEFIGEDPLAEAEVIMIAIEALTNTGLSHFKIDLGHTAYLDGIINDLELTSRQEEEIKTLLNKKDFVGLEEFVNGLNLDSPAKLLELPKLRGDIEILNKAEELVDNSESLKAIKKLKQVYRLLSDYEVSNFLNFDLGLSRGLNYYTGIVFEGFTEKLGYTICGGGRYDGLLEKYGGERTPAVGFALGLQRVWLSLNKENYNFEKHKIDGMVVFSPETRRKALRTTRELHQQGLSIILKEKESSQDIKNSQLFVLAEEQNVNKILVFAMEKSEKMIKIIDVETGKTQTTVLEKGWYRQIWKD